MPKINRITKKDGKIVKTQVDAQTPIYNVRIKPELYEPLVLQASQESRSVTAHINHILATHLNKQ